jgi:acetate kinase
MKILVANLGSTSFKYRLFQCTEAGEEDLAHGGYQRVEDFGAVIEDALQTLIDAGHLTSVDDLNAVGFKTVLGENLSGCVEADDTALQALEGLAAIAPAHNPAYAAGIRQFRRLTQARLVALFETSFYQWVPEAATRYAVPESWYAAGIRRYGFHGASHKYIAERSASLMGRDDILRRVEGLYRDGPGREPKGAPLRVISCHLGGSSSVTAMVNGIAVGTSMGLSPQSGLPQNNRVGDLDSMAIPLVMDRLGLTVEAAREALTKEGGLLGLSGVSNDLRDIVEAAAAGNSRAALAIDCYVHAIRHWIGAFAFQMGGLDALVFTAGIGENQASVRAAVCSGLEAFGLVLDADRNAAAPRGESEIGAEDAAVRIFIIPTNEERVVARETRRLIESL